MRARVVSSGGRLPLMAIAVVIAISHPRGQSITGLDAMETARFDAISRTVAGAGFVQPAVVAHDAKNADDIFALLATRDGKGVLLVAVESKGAAPVGVAELEHADNPASLGIRGVTFGRFLTRADILDIVVEHQPFMLEISRSFETHHLVRRVGTSLVAVCEFAGSTSASSSKGIGSIVSTDRVSVSPSSARRTDLRFAVRTVRERVEQMGKAPPVTTEHVETVTQYLLPASGGCVVE